MARFNSTKQSLQDIIKDIEKGKIQLPDFQRDWVWDDEHIRSLLASVARSFPVGAVMLLENGGDFGFKCRPVANQESLPDIKPEQLVLDGQQRLTSLAAALGKNLVTTRKNSREINVYYYIDIDEALDGDIDNAFVSVSKNKKKIESSGENIDLTAPENKYKYFPCNQIFNSDSWEDELEANAPDEGKRFREFRKKVVTPFREYQLPLITLNRDTSIEAICLIFEKVNTGGVSLTVFELLTAKYAGSKFDLRENWYGKSDSEPNGYLQQLEENPLLKGITPKEFLQAISLLHTYQNKDREKKGAISAGEKAILALPLDAYQNLAPAIGRGFLTAAKFLRSEGFISHNDIPYRPQIVLLAVIFSQLEDDKAWMKGNNLDRIKPWFWRGVFGEGYTKASHSRMAADCETMLNWIQSGCKSKPTSTEESSLVINLRAMKTRASAGYKGLIALIARNAEDFLFKMSIQKMDDIDLSNLDIHHIFPKKWCTTNKVDTTAYNYDCIINKTPISSRANRTIGGKAPSKYLKEMEDEGITPERMDKIIASHSIVPETLRKDDFDSFYKARSKMLVELIEKSTGVQVIREDEGTPEDN